MGTRPARTWVRPLLALAVLAMAGCNSPRDNRTVRVDVIGQSEALAQPLRHGNAPAARLILASTAQGLLSFDARGDIVGALAESWIVEDGGQSYIFRLKRLHWADGKPVHADEVARLLRERMRANPLLLAGLTPDVRAMTDRVIEIRLDMSLPAFLQLLAQPDLAVMTRSGDGTGPYRREPAAKGGPVVLAPATAASEEPTEGEPESEAAPPVERREVRAERASLALVRFRARHTDLVLGGRFQHLPLIAAAGLNMADAQVDPVEGLFGLAFTSTSSFLADAPVRDALARLVDRDKLAEVLGLPGWRTATYPLPASYELNRLPSAPAWSGRSREERVESARRIIDRWRADKGDPPVLRIALPDGSGASVLFLRLVQDFGQAGLQLDRVAIDQPADLRLIDEVAPFDSAFWYLARLDCSAGLLCDPRVASRLAEARKNQNDEERAQLLAEAEEATVAFSGFIPLGRPIRWSLVGQRLTNFKPSSRGVHPLNALITVPN
ncbi:peptide/nickel transport system substrate-binding protein [Sphingobium sp. B1D7B]|uniref:ABC transporter substrate-binding protein n=1 Tax=unclassified Sphingobium TaxID=2611147 RepID=UPI002224DA0D|nr:MULTISPECIES: ABC transporter substrate-binding protein [unclassified Sphingobium]MCW2393401.1 peptide/nickel transport system substrate-binding protein [Sphingobium sp. B11D3A]MCW2405338.1 peptide/nickel transport system substrate-binding protein [Sphingobium sp. B1D7B]